MEIDLTLVIITIMAGTVAIAALWLDHYAPTHPKLDNFDICPKKCIDEGKGEWTGKIEYHAGCLCVCENGSTYGTCM